MATTPDLLAQEGAYIDGLRSEAVVEVDAVQVDGFGSTGELGW